MIGWDEIASGNPVEFYSGMRQYDLLIPEGSRAMLQLNLRLPVSQNTAWKIESALKSAGVPNVKVVTASPVLKVFFKKEFPWLPVIVGIIIPLLIVLAIVIMSWQLFKENPLAGGLTMTLAIGLAAFAGVMLLGRKSNEYAKRRG